MAAGLFFPYTFPYIFNRYDWKIEILQLLYFSTRKVVKFEDPNLNH